MQSRGWTVHGPRLGKQSGLRHLLGAAAVVACMVMATSTVVAEADQHRAGPTTVSAVSARAEGQVKVSIFLIGGPAPAKRRELAGHVFFRPASGKTRKVAVPAKPFVVVLPIGRYGSYATSGAFESGRAKCTPKHALDVTRKSVSVSYYCSAR